MIFSVCWSWFQTRLQVPWLQGLCVSFASVPGTGRLCTTLNSIGYQVGLSILPVELITIVMAPLRAFLDTLLHTNKAELHSAAVWNAHCGTWKAHCPTEFNFPQKRVPGGFENPPQNLKLFSTSLYRSPSFFCVYRIWGWSSVPSLFMQVLFSPSGYLSGYSKTWVAPWRAHYLQ